MRSMTFNPFNIFTHSGDSESGMPKTMLKRLLLNTSAFGIFAFAAFAPNMALADCALTDGNAGPEGSIAYFPVDDTYRYCDSADNWVTLASGGSAGDTLIDADSDTQIQVEEGADDDTIRFDTLGKERLTINNAGGMTFFGAQGDAAAISHGDACTIAGAMHTKSNTDKSIEYMVCDGALWKRTLSMYPETLPAATIGTGFITVPPGVGGSANNATVYLKNGSSSAGQNRLIFGGSFGTSNYGAIGTDGDDAVSDHALTLNAYNNRDIKMLTTVGESVRINGTSGNFGIGDFSADVIDSALHIQSGDIRLDGGAANEAGCIRFDDTADELQFSHDCTTFTAMGAASGMAIDDLTDAYTDYATDYNIFMGSGTGAAIAVGGDNNFGAGINALVDLTTGDQNIAIGNNAAANLIDADDNIAIGQNALNTNTASDRNMAIGSNALSSLASGGSNTAIGSSALDTITTGSNNMAIGYNAGALITSSNGNTLIGTRAGDVLTGGSYNVFLGEDAGGTQTGGSNNIAIGRAAVLPSLTGSDQLNIGDTITGDLATKTVTIDVGTNAAGGLILSTDETGAIADLLTLTNTNGGGNAAGITFDVTGTPRSSIYSYDSGLLVETFAASTPIVVRTDSTERMKISDSGIGMGDFSADVIDSALHIQSGDIRLDGGAANEAGCIRFDDTTDKMQFSNDCTTFTNIEDAGTGLWTDNTTHITRENFHILDAGLANGSTTAGLDGDGTYTFFDPDKGAMRGGTIDSSATTWQDANVGANSFAWGTNSQASGDNSFAFGNYARATNSEAFAFGQGTLASGNNSFAGGYNAQATGNNAFSFGENTISSATETSVALGFEATASGNYSFAFGLGDATTTQPVVSGTSSFGIFMGDQDGEDLNVDNMMVLEGGRFMVGSGSLDNSTYVDAAITAALTASGNAFRWGPAHSNSATLAGYLGYDGGGDYVKINVNDGDLYLYATDSSNDAEMFFDGSTSRIGIGTGFESGTDTVDSTLHIQTGDIRLDGGAANEAGCIRFDDTADELQFSHDCTTFTAMGSASGMAINDLTDAFTAYGGSQNVIMGRVSAADLTSGAQYNTFIGFNAGATTANSTANTDSNTAVGNDALVALTSGSQNIVLGGNALRSNTTGNSNTAIGYRALNSNVNGGSNVALGRHAGYALTTGDNNILIGANVDAPSSTGSNQLNIGGTIYGDLSTGTVGIGTTSPKGMLHVKATGSLDSEVVLDTNGSLSFNSYFDGTNDKYVNSDSAFAIFHDSTADVLNFYYAASGTADNNTNFSGSEAITITSTGDVGIHNTSPSVELDVTGDIEYSGTITDVSDMRLKENIEALTKTGSLLDRIDQIDTYSFTMKGDESGRIEYGVMAQELETIFPELVHTAKDEMGTKSVNYVGLIAPMIEATKELRAENAALKAEQNETKETLKNLSEQVALLNQVVVKENTREGSANYMLLALIFLMGGITGLVALRSRRS